MTAPSRSVHPGVARSYAHLLGGREAAPRPLPRPWLLSIVDLLTILVTFFVLIFSMVKIDMKEFVPVAASYGGAFADLADKTVDTLPKIAAVPGDNLGYLEAVLKSAFTGQPSLREVQFHRTSQYLILTLPDDAFALRDHGRLSVTASGRVFDLGGVLSNIPNRIAVVGTASVTQADDAAGAWELAMTRANAVAAGLAAAGYDKEITVLGRSGVPMDVNAAMGRIEIMIMPERPSP